MTIMRRWTASNGILAIDFECPFFDDLLASSGNSQGRLPRDLPAHALWHYYCAASTQWHRVQHAQVYEGSPDPVFDARALFESIAKMHGVMPAEMVPYWGTIEIQRRAFGLSSNADLPERFKFKFH